MVVFSDNIWHPYEPINHHQCTEYATYNPWPKLLWRSKDSHHHDDCLQAHFLDEQFMDAFLDPPLITPKVHFFLSG